MTPELTLRDTVLERLRATPAVSAVVGEKVYDDVPADGEPDLPWIFAGPLNATRLEVGGLRSRPGLEPGPGGDAGGRGV